MIFLQIINGYIGCCQEIGVIGVDSKDLKKSDIIIDALGCIVCDKYKLPAICLDVFQESCGSFNELIPFTDRTVYIQQKKFFIFQHDLMLPLLF